MDILRRFNMYPVLYTAEIWDDITHKMKTVKGITFADNFTEAAERIEDYYGEILNSVTIELQEEQTVWELKED